jgi:hypothetical protein
MPVGGTVDEVKFLALDVAEFAQTIHKSSNHLLIALSHDQLRNPTRGSLPDGCAHTAKGHAVADPAITLMKSHRRIAFPEAGTTPIRKRLQQGFPTDEMGFKDLLKFNRPQWHEAHRQSSERTSSSASGSLHPLKREG